MIRSLILSVPVLMFAGCATPSSQGEPSLARRSAEAIDPRLPVEVAVDARPTDPSLAARLEALLSEARTSAAAFAAAEPGARSKAAAAGQPESESWVAAQAALSELDRLRAPFARAIADLDELRSTSARSGDRASPADVAALEAAAAELLAISERQSAALDSIREQIAS
jgi:hypothetical protein